MPSLTKLYRAISGKFVAPVSKEKLEELFNSLNADYQDYRGIVESRPDTKTAAHVEETRDKFDNLKNQAHFVGQQIKALGSSAAATELEKQRKDLEERARKVQWDANPRHAKIKYTIDGLCGRCNDAIQLQTLLKDYVNQFDGAEKKYAKALMANVPKMGEIDRYGAPRGEKQKFVDNLGKLMDNCKSILEMPEPGSALERRMSSGSTASADSNETERTSPSDNDRKKLH